MLNPKSFGEIVDAADDLPLEDQEALISILRNRVRERRRAELVKDIQAAQKEFATGKCPPTTPEELMRDILS